MNAINLPVVILVSALLSLSGCVTPPSIDVSRLKAPKSVAIVDIPKMKNVALIGVIVPHAPGLPQFHFSEQASQFFEVANDENHAVLKNNPSAQGLVDAIIFDIANQTQNKANLEYNGEILKRFPEFDLRADFMKALRAALDAEIATTTIAHGRYGQAPRLRWPAQDQEGNKYPSGSLEDFPPVDADILLQVSPIAFYNSPGPLNAYYRNVTVGIALYNGRTKQFIGRQTFRFKPNDSSLEYYSYSGLIEDIPRAAPALREALLSLVPTIVDLVTANTAR